MNLSHSPLLLSRHTSKHDVCRSWFAYLAFMDRDSVVDLESEVQ